MGKHKAKPGNMKRKKDSAPIAQSSQPEPADLPSSAGVEARPNEPKMHAADHRSFTALNKRSRKHLQSPVQEVKPCLNCTRSANKAVNEYVHKQADSGKVGGKSKQPEDLAARMANFMEIIKVPKIPSSYVSSALAQAKEEAKANGWIEDPAFSTVWGKFRKGGLAGLNVTESMVLRTGMRDMLLNYDALKVQQAQSDPEAQKIRLAAGWESIRDISARIREFGLDAFCDDKQGATEPSFTDAFTTPTDLRSTTRPTGTNLYVSRVSIPFCRA